MQKLHLIKCDYFAITTYDKKKDILRINFIDIKPAENSKVTMATTYPYCVLRIENLEKFKISIK